MEANGDMPESKADMSKDRMRVRASRLGAASLAWYLPQVDFKITEIWNNPRLLPTFEYEGDS